jgi:N-hydroxyarylamine O-acetyltransferase
MGREAMRLHDYLQRVGVEPPAAPTIDWLRQVHRAHRRAFLFENLTIQTGGSISVMIEDIERKFLDRRQGGYCFEHNSLFAAVLRDVGYDVAPFLGRVRRGPPERWARTHMVLKVGSQGSLGARGSWLADVGFGALSLIEPMPLREGASVQQGGLTYTLRREGGLWVLAMRDAIQDVDLYEFNEDPQTLGDVIVANHYTSTHPESIFRRSLTIQTVRGDERITLRAETISRYVGGVLREEPLDRARLRDAARDLFGVEIPDGPLVYEQYAVNV